MKVAYDDESSWPFVWYLRNFNNAQFYGKKPGGPFDAEVVIVGSANEAAVKPFLGNRYYRRAISPDLVAQPGLVHELDARQALWNDFKDPVARAKFWDVVYNRKHEAPLTAWPYVHNFALYVRRDVAQQLWDYGPEVRDSGGPALPGDDYAGKRWAPLAAQRSGAHRAASRASSERPRAWPWMRRVTSMWPTARTTASRCLTPTACLCASGAARATAPGQFNEPWGVAVAAERRCVRGRHLEPSHAGVRRPGQL